MRTTDQDTALARGFRREVLAVCGFLACILGNAIAWAGQQDAETGEQLRDEAVRILRRTLHHQMRWVKVHAAEYLLALGYPEKVQEVFGDELSARGDEPQYRIGIWRVLARAAEDDAARTGWLARIRAAAFDPRGKDRLHAVEALAKLGYRVSVEEVAAIEQEAQSDRGAMTGYARWLLIHSGRPETLVRLAELLASPDARTRGCAGYALRHLRSLPPELAERLAQAAGQEPVDSPARAPLVGAAAVHATDETREAFRQELLALASGKTGEPNLEAIHALAQVGEDRDVGSLRELLSPGNADRSATAAYTILRIERRRPHHLAGWDWLVIGAYLVGMLSVGWYCSRQTRTREEYLLGGRQMKPLTVGVSLFASLISTISYLSWPGEVIKNGPMILGNVLAYPLVALVVGWLMIPFIMRLKVTSAYEILELRLGPGVRMLGSLMFLSLRLLWMSVIVYATTSKVLVPLLGLDPWVTPLVCILLGSITVVYTTMGGLKAVVMTDVIQSAILFGSALATVIVVTISLGGVGAWWPDHWASHWQVPVYGYDPTARVTLFGAMLASFTWFVCTSGSDQIVIQRYLATRDAPAARTVLNISLVADTLVALLLAAVGLSLLAYFTARPFLLPDTQVVLHDADQLFPRFIVVGLPAGVSGLVVAGLLAAAMSALSAGVNSTSSVIAVDFLDRFRKAKATSDSAHVRQVQWVSFFVGAVVVSLSLCVPLVRGNLLEIAYKVVNLLTAPLFGLFFMAMFVRWATGFGALVGAACGIATAITICYWTELTGAQGMSFLWAMPLSLLVEVGVASLASLLPIGRPAVPLEQVA